MKQIYTFLFALLSVVAFSTLNAQISSLEFIDLETEVEKDGVWGALDEKALIANTGSSSLSLVAERITNDILPEHDSYFCWNQECYAPDRNVSDAVNVATGDTVRDYVLSVNPKGTAGVSTVTMAFYDEATPNDRVTHTIRFTINETTGRVEAENFLQLSQPFPNPAFNSTRFDLQAGAFASVELMAIDGRRVYSQTISASETVVELNTTELTPGQYVAVFRGEAGVQSRRLAVQ